MKKQWLLGLPISVLLSMASPAYAVDPAPIGANDRVAWSQVVENPYDGKIVYDRNYSNDFVLVTSWSKNGIRATYSQLRTELAGYQTRYNLFDRWYGRRWSRDFFDDVPVYVRYQTDSVPASIKLAINGQTYTYTEGAVSPELAAALASAPSQNLLIRLVWADGRTRDVEIGRGTVEAWRTIFRT